jgi:hypothetical protein
MNVPPHWQSKIWFRERTRSDAKKFPAGTSKHFSAAITAMAFAAVLRFPGVWIYVPRADFRLDNPRGIPAMALKPTEFARACHLMMPILADADIEIQEILSLLCDPANEAISQADAITLVAGYLLERRKSHPMRAQVKTRHWNFR